MYFIQAPQLDNRELSVEFLVGRVCLDPYVARTTVPHRAKNVSSITRNLYRISRWVYNWLLSRNMFKSVSLAVGCGLVLLTSWRMRRSGTSSKKRSSQA
jgi:hypothetical protein